MILYVGSVPVPIREVDREAMGDDDASYGSEQGVPSIVVANDLADGYRDNVIAHEWVHAWLALSGVGQYLALADTAEELFCDVLAHDLIRLMEVVAAKGGGLSGGAEKMAKSTGNGIAPSGPTQCASHRRKLPAGEGADSTRYCDGSRRPAGRTRDCNDPEGPVDP